VSTTRDERTFDLRGDSVQNGIIREALTDCTFPFERLSKQNIPVEWADLSRYAASPVTVDADGSHAHVHDGDDTGHPIVREVDGRARVLGLAWYSGKVTIDASLERDPRLAAEVFLAEGAHMVDFFYMTNAHRVGVVNALHHQQLPAGHQITDGIPLGLDGHECGWFDVGPYSMWVGEAWMESFIEAFSSERVTIQLGHPVSPVQARYIRRLLLGPTLVGTRRGRAYHRPTCPFIRPSWVLTPHGWPTPDDAQAAGRRACRVCRPT
jgi:hypothetical protein